jgi:hypothetical protein
MAASLSVFTKEGQVSVVGFCGWKVYQGPQFIRDFQHNAGTAFCHDGWIEKLKNGRTSVMLEEGAGCLSMATNEGNIEHAYDMVLLGRQVTIDYVANHLQISHGSAYEIIHN